MSWQDLRRSWPSTGCISGARRKNSYVCTFMLVEALQEGRQRGDRRRKRERGDRRREREKGQEEEEGGA